MQQISIRECRPMVLQQADFLRNRSCADQIASLRIIVEQSLERNSHSTSTSLTTRRRLIGTQRDTAEILWCSPDHLPNSLHLPGNELQNRPRRPDVRQFLGEDWSASGLPTVAVPLPPGY
jgi:hypothetical protein